MQISAETKEAAGEIDRYIADLDKIYRSGKGTEHSYRPALKTLLEAITSGLTITNEPKRIVCGAPDYIITKGDIPVGYIEAKDITVGIHDKQSKEQFARYKRSLNNLIITDYLTFELFADGELKVSVSIAKENGGTVQADKKSYPAFAELIKTFVGFQGKTIYQSEQLARMMAGKARLLAAVIERALRDKNAEDGSLSGQLEAFRKILIHDLAPAAFADIYAQTLAYGLFAARMNDSSAETFNRGKAAALIPLSNPFLRKFFQYIARYDLDDRIRWIVDALADIFNWVSVEELLKEFGRANQDPFIHFYETFLAEYDPKLRESRGVYYTPLPAVKFIVRAADDILEREFNLPRGLADNSKVTRTIKDADGTEKKVEFHKVQILDPATGTGTFLAETINKIYERFSGQKGMWQNYCGEHLIPRLHGFEILMASYAMAHLKFEMSLRETGYKCGAGERVRVYLTNSLEEATESIPAFFFMVEWLAKEAHEAAEIKRDVPVMVVMGNPPYNVSTQNKNNWIDALISDYKKEPDGAGKLREQKLNLDDDYVKFIRFGQHLTGKNESGILAYINNNGFIDNPTFRGMRWNLLQEFDKIYILDLHGNVRKRETAPDGSKDENVFDIQQGTSINIFIKTGKKKSGDNAEVFHAELYGKRRAKYAFLLENTIETIAWEKLAPHAPHYFFVPKNFDNKQEYEQGFSVKEIFPLHNSGVKTDRDSLFIDMDKNELVNRIKTLLSGSAGEYFIERFNVKDSGSYKLTRVIKNKTYSNDAVMPIMYRPFDLRYIYYQPSITSRPAHTVMRHLLRGENVGIIVLRSMPAFQRWSGVFVSNCLTEFGIGGSFPGNSAPTFPLYLYPEADSLDSSEARRPNLNDALVNMIAEKTGLLFTPEKEITENTFAPIDILDYVYAVLHSPAYREKYREFLKIDFPRVPYPENAERFCAIAALGADLRKAHLLENIDPSDSLGAYPVEGSNTVEKPEYKDAKVWINKQQYFDEVPLDVWDFYIGGYQSAQKWLKDRKGRVINYDEIEHYQKILAALQATIDLQARIDGVIG